MTPFILAQTNASNDALGSWVVIAAFCGGGLTLLLQVVAFFATRRELEALEKRLAEHQAVHSEIFTKIGGMERGLRGEFREEIKTMREELSEAANTIAAVNRSAEMLNQQIIEARARIDHIKDNQ